MAAEKDARGAHPPRPARGGRPLLALLALASLSLLPGCLNVAFGDARGPSAPTAEGESFAEFMDLPYPPVMTLETRNTFAYERKGIRAGVVTVVGRLSADEIGAYYDSHLPAHGWAPLAEAQSTKLVSTWTKGQKVLTIVTSPITLSIGSDTRLELWVAPPHSQGDLGQRIVYGSTGPREEAVIQTTPIRGGPRQGGFTEEDI
ncbi:MAG: hypothetical protein LBL95_01315 [Deltaproteobacteria bacterium]|jgi:hypothetical protein|nr:hypothetical protein [Deltaproteobacteria bacterium]